MKALPKSGLCVIITTRVTLLHPVINAYLLMFPAVIMNWTCVRFHQLLQKSICMEAQIYKAVGFFTTSDMFFF